jgi:prepilin-type N-terminal cleavage/methylation domain-containing protein
MNNAGFTLSEMLVALTLTSLAMGGLAFSASAFARAEARLERGRTAGLEVRRLERTTEAFMADAAWLSSPGEGFSGDERSMRIGCGQNETCEIKIMANQPNIIQFRRGAREESLSLTQVAALRLSYLTVSPEGGLGETEGPTPGDLRAIVFSDGMKRLALYRVLVEQDASCSFDRRLGSCTARATP